MSTLRAIMLAASIEFGYAYMHYDHRGWKEWVLLAAFSGCVMAYGNLAHSREAKLMSAVDEGEK